MMANLRTSAGLGWALILYLLTVSSTQADTALSKNLVYADSEAGALIRAYETGTMNLQWTTTLSGSVTINSPFSISADKESVYVGFDAEEGGGLAALAAPAAGTAPTVEP